MKRLRNLFWRMALSSPGLRRKLAFQLKHFHPADLDVRIPIGEGIYSPLFDEEIGASFREIFLEREYGALSEHIPLPRRWIDFGCYAGFFSLWMMWQRRCAGNHDNPEVLLVDADAHRTGWMQRMIAINQFGKSWNYRCAAISAEKEECEYVPRSYMGSSLASTKDAAGGRVRVPVISEAEILRIFPPPYDLIKVDIEGAEYELLRAYPAVLQHSAHLCIEWHSWHPGGGGREQICQMVEALGFEIQCELQAPRLVHENRQTGVLLYKRNAKSGF